jgi:hypothetical protein
VSLRSPFPANTKKEFAMAVSGQRLARNQVLLREVNERLREALEGSPEPTEFLCECSDEDCIEIVALERAE